VPSLKKYRFSGEQVGEVAIENECLKTETCPQMIKDYIVAMMANARQWSANTKGRSEVCHSRKKPHAQKGTGRARQGSLAAPQYKGGGRVFAPKPKFDQHVRINKKERRAAISYLLSEKILNDKVIVLQNEAIETPKTKIVSQFLTKSQLADQRVLFLAPNKTAEEAEGQYAPLIKSMRNIQKTNFKRLLNVNGYDVALNQHIVVLESAVEELKELLMAKS
jgi:large subunit ribosomal protein L4